MSFSIAKLLNKNTARNPQDRALEHALEIAAQVEDQLPRRIRAFEEKLKTDPSAEYDIWYMTEHARRTKETAERRIEYWAGLDTEEKRQEEWDKCKADTKHFFRQWAWTEDPRPSSILTRIPFEPFPRQLEFIDWLEDMIFSRFESGGVLKSRTAGASWICTALAEKHWLFSDPSEVIRFLFLSRTHDEADTIGDMKSLLEKVRFNLRLMPSFLLPAGLNFKKHLGSTILNPHSGAVIASHSFTGNAARGDRATAVFLDEQAAGKYADQKACWGSLTGGVSDCVIGVSTPQGMRNQFYKNYGTLPFFSIHWKDNPLLYPPDREDLQYVWHNRQKIKMNDPALFAQEVEMKFDTSQAGAVYPQFKEDQHVITWKEFAKIFPEAIDRETGRTRIPPTWTIGRAFDVGTTAKHPGVMLWVARSPEFAALPGCIFVYREVVVTEAIEATRLAKMIRDAEAIDNEGPRVVQSVISHEQSALKVTFGVEHGLHFSKANTSYESGIAQIRDYLAPRGEQPHPFHPELPEGGAPRMFLIVANEQGGLFEDATGNLRVKPAIDSRGLKRLREEFPAYHYPDTEEGKAVSAMRPFKDFDDAMDALRYLANSFFPAALRETAEQRILEDLPEEFHPENLAKLGYEELALKLLRRDEYVAKLHAKHSPPKSRLTRAMEKIGNVGSIKDTRIGRAFRALS